jgi:hypothetical protein
MKPICLQGAEKTAIRLLRMAGVMLWLDFQSAKPLEKKRKRRLLAKQAGRRAELERLRGADQPL